MVQVPHTEILGIKTLCDFGLGVHMCRYAKRHFGDRRISKPLSFLRCIVGVLAFLSVSPHLRFHVEFSTYAISAQISEGGMFRHCVTFL